MDHDGPAHLAVSARDPLLRGRLGVYHGKRDWGFSVEFDVRHRPVTLLGLGQAADGSLSFIGGESAGDRTGGCERGGLRAPCLPARRARPEAPPLSPPVPP